MKQIVYQQFIADLKYLFNKETPSITLLANFSGELKLRFPSFSWVGFYLYDGQKLILGPFQGKPACEEITLNRGVCGTCASKRQTIIVPDVHKFSGHIACDGGSNSEIVVPIVINEQLYGVLDVDSYSLDNFNEIDKEYLEEAISYIAPLLKPFSLN